MNKFLIGFVSSCLLMNTAFAAQPIVTHSQNSFFQAVLEHQANQYKDRTDTIEATKTNSYHHADEQRNSLARAVLAKQGVGGNIVITSKNQISTSQYDPGEENNSLFSGALSKHYKNTHSSPLPK